MREILFRGLRTDGKGWAYGYYYEYSGKHIISYQDHSDNSTTDHWHEVIPETVGQYIGVSHRDIDSYMKGIFDSKGNVKRTKVFEGDIVEFKIDPSFYINAKIGDRYIIEQFGAGFFMKPISWGNVKISAQNYVGLLPPYQTFNMSNHYEVIGNIHETRNRITNL